MIPGKATCIALCIILILVSPLSGLSQGKPDAPALPVYEDWVSFTTEDGLIDDHAYWVKVDTVHSCVWAGTDNGLACYLDGRWKVYTPKDVLAHQAVMGVDVDPRTGEVWVATFGGLNRLSAGRFETFTQFNSGLANDVVYSVAVQGDTIWAATTAGTGQFIRKTGQWNVFTSQNAPMDENWCYNVSVGEGKVYLAVWGGGILEYDLASGHWQKWEDPDGEFEIDLFRDDGLIHVITTAVSYREGILWASTYFGMSSYDGHRWRGYMDHDTGLASNFINFIRARGPKAWACTDKGLSGVHYESNRWVTYAPQQDPMDYQGAWVARVYQEGDLLETVPLAHGLANNFILGVDFQGDDVWVATSKGISRGRLGSSESSGKAE